MLRHLYIRRMEMFLKHHKTKNLEYSSFEIIKIIKICIYKVEKTVLKGFEQQLKGKVFGCSKLFVCSKLCVLCHATKAKP